MNNDDFLFVPLGGVGKIGMNVSLYHYQGKWIMLDLGVGFAGNDMPGIDLIVADISFIAERKEDLLGIILTHAHEDHLGAIQYLWKDLQCPVFATKFTATFLKSKLREFKLEDVVPINVVETNKNFELDPFTIEFINVTHSIPEANAIAIGAGKNTVLHTGDWKFDPNPVIGPASNKERLKELGDKGLLAVICDSTNAFTKTESQSESGVYDHIYNIVKESKQLVAVSLFASNVARIETIVRVAKALKRKVALLGKSLWRIVEVSQESGYLLDSVEFLEAKDVSNSPRNEVLLLCTGCQGEPLAASSKLAQNTHATFKMQKGDTIIFSSKIIPGNEQRIHNMFNSFVMMGVEVITEDTRHVHVSGHPVREELKTMYSLTKPKIAIPVHGEYIHMYEHTKLAQECGVKQSVMVRPGDVIDLINAKKIDSVQSGYFGVDGKFLRHPDSDVMKMRRSMQDAGFIIITIVMNKNKLLNVPTVLAPGVLDPQKDQGMIKKILKEIESALYLKELKKIRQKIRHSIYDLLKKQRLKKPLIDIQIERI